MRSTLVTKLVVAVFVSTVILLSSWQRHRLRPLSALVFQYQPQQQQRQCLPSADAVNVVDPRQAAFEQPGPDTHCVTSTVANLTLPICTYLADEDIWVSAAFQRGDYWESALVGVNVAVLWRLRNASPPATDVGYVDIGANVGGYGLAAAHAGFQVTAVEANWLTMRHLSSSVVLGNLTDRVTLIHNAVSDVSGSTVQLGVQRGNRGHTAVMSAEYCLLNPSDVECRNVMKGIFNTTTIVLDDLLTICPRIAGSRVVMKVDIEGSELAAFDPRTSSRFLNEVDVFAIQMEWKWMKERKDLSSVEDMLRYLQRFGYTARNIDFELSAIKAVNWHEWPYDVIFVKQDADFVVRRPPRSA